MKYNTFCCVHILQRFYGRKKGKNCKHYSRFWFQLGCFVQLIPIIMMTIGVDVLLYDYGSGLHLTGVDLL